MAPQIPLPQDADLPDDIRETLANMPPANVFRMLANAPASFQPFMELAMSILLRLLINAAALWVATRIVNGISFTGDIPTLLGVALVFGVLNAVLRPILMVLTIPFLIITLGLFTFVLNAVMLLITSAASDALGLGFQVDGFGSAFLGALVVSLVSFALSMFVGPSGNTKRD